MSHNLSLATLGLCAILWFGLVCQDVASGQEAHIVNKQLAFRDPNTNYVYKVNVSRPSSEPAFGQPPSQLTVYRARYNNNVRSGPEEKIQTLVFTPALVDFDTHCSVSHCYMVVVTAKTTNNVFLYLWTRTQWDEHKVKDSYARPHAVRLLQIKPGQFYIAIAQDQLQLSHHRFNPAPRDSEPPRFLGCALLKFTKGKEDDIKYHQFIRLPFEPRYVHHFTTINSGNFSEPRALATPTQSHHLVFSVRPDWTEPETTDVRIFRWSPINDYFWPFRMPRNAEIMPSAVRPGSQVIRFPELQPLFPTNVLNYTQQPNNYRNQHQEYVGSVETCFYQLQRLLADRDLEARRLIAESHSVWRANVLDRNGNSNPSASLTNISAQVIVDGNVIVKGSVIDQPQISLFGPPSAPPGVLQALPSIEQVTQMVYSHSPALLANKFRTAKFKLDRIRDKLMHAVTADGFRDSFSSQIRFYAPIQAEEVVFNGVANSNMRLNGIPFRQLENELLSLNGEQKIGARVIFEGKVVADRLTITALINNHSRLKDAIDITSNRIQVIETGGLSVQPGLAGLDFRSVSAPEVVLNYNSTINSIRLNDFITRDNRTQLVMGRKSFKRLSMAKLDLAHQSVLLNGLNISRLARNAIRLRPEPNTPPGQAMFQTVSSQHGTTFLKPISVDRLTINGFINQHINLTSLIKDSIKAHSYEVQQIFGQKTFMNGLKVGRLNTEGALNGIEVSQIFNLNPAPPIPEHQAGSAINVSVFNGAPTPAYDVPIEGRFSFGMPVQVRGSVNANLVNGIDLTQRAVRRTPPSSTPPNGQHPPPPQMVRGRKTFYRPLRILNDIRLVDLQQASRLANNATIPYPLVNGVDLRAISAGLARHMRQPPLIFVENLEIEGNLDFPIDRNGSTLYTPKFGNYSVCPLDLIRSRVVLAGDGEQIIEAPIRVKSLKAKTILVEPGALNGYNFPGEFVLRTTTGYPSANSAEQIYGVKTIEHLLVSPSLVPSNLQSMDSRHAVMDRSHQQSSIVLGSGASINQVAQSELQAFIGHERYRNATGERVYNTVNVYGNIISTRINGNQWPRDILLRSESSNPFSRIPAIHKRIYSHLIFTNTSSLRVQNQLVLRGPIQLNGRMNGVNLTEFSRQSATYGDKDLYSNGRPVRNKVFLGGLSVRNNIRSQGMIDGVNLEEMKRRVVTTHPTEMGLPVHVLGEKVFTDVTFDGPVRMFYLNGLPVDYYLSRIRFEPDGITLKVRNKKTITGTLRINRNLHVRGLINGVDFAELRARAISLAPNDKEIRFNKSFIVEGDVYMDNLWIDQHNGTIDGVRLKNLLHLDPRGNEEFALADYQLVRDPSGRLVGIAGSLMECKIGCDLLPFGQSQSAARGMSFHPVVVEQPLRNSARGMSFLSPDNNRGPVIIPTQSVMSFTSRPTLFNQNNFTITRTTPPYSLASSYQAPLMQPTLRPAIQAPRPVFQQQLRQMEQLSQRRPVQVRFDSKPAARPNYYLSQRNSFVANELENIRRRIISINLVRLSRDSNLVVGFIDAPTNDISSYQLPERDLSHNDHPVAERGPYLILDEIDYPIPPSLGYHMTILVDRNTTKVRSYLAAGSSHIDSELPVVSPRSALFVEIHGGYLFLLVSQGQPEGMRMCMASEMTQPMDHYADNSFRYHDQLGRLDDGVQVYLFQFLRSSSSMRQINFDLYQTIDLPSISSFEKFDYGSITYVLATSRDLGRVYLLLMRGYTGFQTVSRLDIPLIDHVMVVTKDEKPVIVARLTDGRHRILEAVII